MYVTEYLPIKLIRLTAQVKILQISLISLNLQLNVNSNKLSLKTTTMKKFLALFLLLFGLLISAQEIPVKSDSVYAEVEEAAEYPGGLQKFRQAIMKDFNASKITGKGMLASETTFVITTEGRITDIKYTGNAALGNEMVRVLSNIKERWIPAKINGQPVKSNYRLPMNMRFE